MWLAFYKCWTTMLCTTPNNTIDNIAVLTDNILILIG